MSTNPAPSQDQYVELGRAVVKQSKVREYVIELQLSNERYRRELEVSRRKIEKLEKLDQIRISEIQRLEKLLVQLGESRGEPCETCRGTGYDVSTYAHLDDIELEAALIDGLKYDLDECDNPTCFGGWEVDE